MYYSFSEKYAAPTNKLITETTLLGALPQKDFLKVRAIWDTGATHSVISNKIKEQMKLIPISSKLVYGVNSKQYVDIVAASIKLPNDLVIDKNRFYVCNLPSGIDMLIGMDIIQLGNFHISNTDGKTQFSFVVPPLPSLYDLAEEAQKLNG
ncbi:MAG: retropepsin-like domain-containing protein [Treponema sp.]|jgi:predicted aspartyl protease|nr:retropepsin-like domain-containing protein [Treponema sp.]